MRGHKYLFDVCVLFLLNRKLLDMWQYTNKNFRRKFLQGNALAFPFFNNYGIGA